MDVDDPEDYETESEEPTGGYWSDLWKSFKTETRRFKFYLEVLAVIGAVVYTIYTIKMYSANKHSADAAKSAAETAKQTLLITNRAWLETTVDTSNGFMKEGETFKKFRDDMKIILFPLKVTNMGKLPVSNVQIVAVAEILNSDEFTTFRYGGDTRMGQTTVIGALAAPVSALQVTTFQAAPCCTLRQSANQELQTGCHKAMLRSRPRNMPSIDMTIG